MMRRVVVPLILMIALACAPAAPRRIETRHVQGYSFEASVLIARDGVVGRITATLGTVVNAAAPIRAARIRVTEVIKGQLRSGEEVVVVSNSGGTDPWRSLRSREVLFVGSVREGSFGGFGALSSPLVVSLAASYVRESIGGRDLGIRLYGPRAADIDGLADREAIREALRAGDDVRPVNASPWGELLARAANPAEELGEQLGYEEDQGWIDQQRPRYPQPSQEPDNLEHERELMRNEERTGPGPSTTGTEP